MKNPYKKKVKDILTNRNEFATWINKDCFVEKNFKLLSKRVLLTTHRVQKEFVKHDRKGDMVHGIFTTTFALLKLLLEGLLKKNGRILYMDTNSIIFMDYPDDESYVESIETRNVLGCWVDEIKPKKHPVTGRLCERFITAFTSGGPKNYGLEICWCNEDGTIQNTEAMLLVMQ